MFMVCLANTRQLPPCLTAGLMLLTALLNSRGQPRLAFPLSHCSTGHRTEASAQSMGTAAAALEQVWVLHTPGCFTRT